MRVRETVLLQVLVCCLLQNKNGFAQQLTDDRPTKLETLVSVGKTIYKCMSSRLSKAAHTLQANDTPASSVNNCWYRQEYGTCLSDNMGSVSHVTAVNNDVYPKNCLIQQATSTKCISDALSEVDKYGCEAKVVDAMKKLGDSPSSADDLKEAYCRASVTAYECVLSVVKYCGVTEGPRTIEDLTQFSVVRTACGAFLPVTTTASPVNIGPIGDLFPKSFFSSSTNGSQGIEVNAALNASSCEPPRGAVLYVAGSVVLLCVLLL